MGKATGKTSPDGQYAKMRAKIAKVAAQALRTAAKFSQVGKRISNKALSCSII